MNVVVKNVEEKTVISEFKNRKQFLDVLAINPGLLLIKFGATWCRPCQAIKSQVDKYFQCLPNTVLCADIDVDTSFDVYAYLKAKKMVSGIPIILCYKKGNTTFAPDDSVSGSDVEDIDNFFQRCNLYLNQSAI